MNKDAIKNFQKEMDRHFRKGMSVTGSIALAGRSYRRTIPRWLILDLMTESLTHIQERG